jgi:hypothetical protein
MMVQCLLIERRYYPFFAALVAAALTGAARKAYTLFHGDYRAENLAHADRPVALDWQEAAYSLMTIDLAWFAKQGFVQQAMEQVQAISFYRERLETNLGQRFDDAEWQVMVDLGYLVDALRSTCFSAYWYKHSDDPNDRPRLEMDVKIRNQQVRDALLIKRRTSAVAAERLKISRLNDSGVHYCPGHAASHEHLRPAEGALP